MAFNNGMFPDHERVRAVPVGSFTSNTSDNVFQSSPYNYNAQYAECSLSSPDSFLSQSPSPYSHTNEDFESVLNYSQDDAAVPYYGSQMLYNQAQPEVTYGTAFNAKEEAAPKTLRECLNKSTPASFSSSTQMGFEQTTSQAPVEPLNYALAREKMDQVHQLALRISLNDVQLASKSLCISADPTKWTAQNTHSWLLFTCVQYGVEPQHIELKEFVMAGLFLCALDLQAFCLRSPQYGEFLWSALEIWKIASNVKLDEAFGDYETSQQVQAIPQQQHPMMGQSRGVKTDVSLQDLVYDPASNLSMQVCAGPRGSFNGGVYTPFRPHGSPISTRSSIDEGVDGMMDPISDDESTMGDSYEHSGNTTGAHTHLWTFLKELLSKPNQHGSAIRWINHSEGIFKIEDSVRVARLWGLRKNRPAMNYDKLSRSIRQYYKKGIMKKTARSQRLVYQFCQPFAQ
ncbi:hypothetical protein RvY_00679 [Ramazzottius varieornatus]|uniref:ETS domain-containing protein n=1 Tax=Ramazzottius varieornatus TaxID=947166 RepID=A0A1D1UEI2_RAMVA|nr:hypothetical protein RvY_00679 [Ramazzottius varieornatus]